MSQAMVRCACANFPDLYGFSVKKRSCVSIAALREAIGAKAFKTQSIPVSYVKGLSDKKAKLLNLALNRISGKWNYSKLADVFGSFGEDDDAALSGFSKKELEDVLTMMAEDPLADDGSDPDALLVAHALRMIFDFESEKDANLVKKALKAAGMTGPGDQAKALLAVCAAYPIPKAKR